MGPLEDGLVHSVARASGLLLSDQAVAAVLQLLTSTAAQTVTASCGAGVTLTGPDGEPLTAAGTDPLVEAADALQYELAEGPCLTAWQTRRAIVVHDVAADRRWPAWGAAVAAVGIGSALSSPLVAGDVVVGAMKLYGRQPGAFTEHDVATLAMFAAQCAVLVTSAQTFRRAGELTAEVQALLAQRDVLARATGLIMGRDGLPERTAFAHLTSRAQRDAMSVHDVAAQVLASHQARASHQVRG